MSGFSPLRHSAPEYFRGCRCERLQCCQRGLGRWPRMRARARKIATTLDGRVIVVSSVAVLCEYHRLRLYRDGIERARGTASALLADPMHRWLPVTQDLITAAIQNWIARFPDQQFSLTDAVSFEIMKREKLTLLRWPLCDGRISASVVAGHCGPDHEIHPRRLHRCEDIQGTMLFSTPGPPNQQSQNFTG